jgi:hypothetical protein
MYIKPVAKYHRDYMRLVNELDTKGDIPFNLTSIEFHNLSQELKQELLNQGYSVPLNTNSIAEQYKNLSDLLAKATEAERKIKQVSLLIRNTIGQQNRSVSTMAYYSPSNPTEDDNQNEEMRELSGEQLAIEQYSAYLARNAGRRQLPHETHSSIRFEPDVGGGARLGVRRVGECGRGLAGGRGRSGRHGGQFFHQPFNQAGWAGRIRAWRGSV